MPGDDLGDRMKGYEDASRLYLTRRMPLVIRVDGKAFHTLTHDMDKPWDDKLIGAMQGTALYLQEHVQGCKLAYCQSDEISLLITDYDKLTTSSWFDKNLQKMVSVSASMATLAFNTNMSISYPHKAGLFDSRAFILSKEEVCNYFLWRQQDAARNSVQMLGRYYFSHKQLLNKNNKQIQEMLFQEHGVNWNDTPTHKKRGFCIKGRDVDLEIPMFNENRLYIESLLEPQGEL